MTRIHPRHQIEFSRFLDQDWEDAPAFPSIDYRFDAYRQGEWMQVRHTGTLATIDGVEVISGMIELISSPHRSRTLLERLGTEMVEGETRLSDFLEEATALSSDSGVQPLLTLLRKAIRSDTLCFVRLDSRLDVTEMISARGSDTSLCSPFLIAPLRRALGGSDAPDSDEPGA